MYIEFKRRTNKKLKRTIEDALWFAKSYLLPRHKIDEIHIEPLKFDQYGLSNLNGDVYDLDDRSYYIRINRQLSVDDLIKTIFHEFVHIKQHIKKEFGGDVFAVDKSSKVAYEDRPYEIEAFKLERKMFDNYIEK